MASANAANNQSISASTLMKTGFGILRGMYVSSTSAGTVKIYDGLTNAGRVMLNTITPAVGFHSFGDSSFATGLYVEITGTIVLTPMWE